MPSSNNNSEVGTIFLGPTKSRESTIEQLLKNTGETWNRSTEEEYMRRVKEKALIKVKATLAKAGERAKAIEQEAYNATESFRLDAKKREELADREKEKALKAIEEANKIIAEAEAIKLAAKEEGKKLAEKEAYEKFSQEKNLLAQANAKILLSIHEQCITIFNSWRKDLVDILIEAVQRASGYLLENEKVNLFQSLLDQTVSGLLDKREYQVRVCSKEARMLTSLLQEMHKGIASTRRWNLISDDTLEEGSIIVESPSGLIQNDRAQRENFVNDILKQLTLPLSEGDQRAFDTVSEILISEGQKAKIPLNSPDEFIETSSLTQENIEGSVPNPLSYDSLQNSAEDTSDSQIFENAGFSMPKTENTFSHEALDIVATEFEKEIPVSVNTKQNKQINPVKQGVEQKSGQKLSSEMADELLAEL